MTVLLGGRGRGDPLWPIVPPTLETKYPLFPAWEVAKACPPPQRRFVLDISKVDMSFHRHGSVEDRAPTSVVEPWKLLVFMLQGTVTLHYSCGFLMNFNIAFLT